MGSDTDTDADVDGVGSVPHEDAGEQEPHEDAGEQEPHEDTENSDSESTSFIWETVTDYTERDGRNDPVPDASTGSDAPPEPNTESNTASTSDGGSESDFPRARTLDPERYLLAGETLDEQVDVRRGWVVATSHRLVVFDPDADGKRFVTVDRPNVVDVRTTGGGKSRLRSYAFRAGVYAVVLCASGSVAHGMGLPDLFTANPDVGSTPGVGGLVSVLSLVGALVGLVADVLFIGGVLAGVVALVLYTFYRRGRVPTLVVERAGEEDLEVELPSNAVGRRVVDSLERAFSDELSLARG